MQKIFSWENIKQFFSYFCVGGIAALVEWIMFFLFSSCCRIEYRLATVLAFIFSTAANWILGRIMTFRNSTKYEGKRLREVILVFAVSAIGLLFNLALMFLFVEVFHLDSTMLMTMSKIMATGIVFIWNFLIRKLLIYRS